MDQHDLWVTEEGGVFPSVLGPSILIYLNCQLSLGWVHLQSLLPAQALPSSHLSKARLCVT